MCHLKTDTASLFWLSDLIGVLKGKLPTVAFILAAVKCFFLRIQKSLSSSLVGRGTSPPVQDDCKRNLRSHFIR